VDQTHLPGALVIGEVFPWWSLVASKLGVRVMSIWTSSHSPFLNLIQRSTASIVPRVNLLEEASPASASAEFQSVQVVFADEGLSCLSGYVWQNHSIRWVIMSGTTAGPPPWGWYKSETMLNHQKAGGVTNYSQRMVVFGRSSNILELDRLPQPVKPSQDLRSVLKVAKSGKPVPNQFIPRVIAEVARDVEFIEPGLVSCQGLMPVKMTISVEWPKVRTIFGGKSWVDRKLLPMEQLQALDLPETVIRMASDEERSLLTKLWLTPLKVRQALCEMVAPFIKMEQPVRISRQLEVSESMTKSKVKVAAVPLEEVKQVPGEATSRQLLGQARREERGATYS
jgi:hypothetical protein